jgi:glycerophosphoryl diester phosphodiesterase
MVVMGGWIASQLKRLRAPEMVSIGVATGLIATTNGGFPLREIRNRGTLRACRFVAAFLIMMSDAPANDQPDDVLHSCRRESMTMACLLDLGRHPVIGHRGASGSAPENTMQAFALAVEQGADALEFDLRLSSDGVPVVIHDPTLDRTTDQTGEVRACTAARLAGLGVPRLVEVLERFRGTPLLIELKVAEVAEAARRLLLEHGAEQRSLIASFLDEALVPFRDGGFHTSASRRGIASLAFRSMVGLSAPLIPDQAYSVPDRYKDRIHVPTERFIRSARKAGCPVHVWTVNDPARAVILWKRGASGMITNFPAPLLAERNRLFPGEASNS